MTQTASRKRCNVHKNDTSWKPATGTLAHRVTLYRAYRIEPRLQLFSAPSVFALKCYPTPKAKE
jgi:hypothetical protein